MADSKVVINDETFDLLTMPDAKSKMVLKAKDLLLGLLDLRSLVDDLGKFGNFIHVAYNGVAGHSDGQIKVRRVSNKVTKLADKSAVTVHQFKGASQRVLQELKSTNPHFFDGFEEMALETLSMLTDVAAAMAKAADELAKAADELHSDFVKATEDVIGARKKTHLEERKDFESRITQAEQREKNALEAEARAQLLYDKVNVMMSAAGNAMMGNVEKAVEAIEKMKHLDELQKEQEIRKKAMEECIEFPEKIKRCQDDNALADAAEALYSSTGVLEYLSAVMMKIALFWQQMQSQCESIAKGEMQKLVQKALDKYDDEKRLKVWTSTGFKKSAVQYYSKWVALDDVCGVYMLQIRDTRQDLYNYLEENPTIEQAKKNVRQLATEFAKDLKQAQEKLAEDNQKALEEKKSLEDN